MVLYIAHSRLLPKGDTRRSLRNTSSGNGHRPRRRFIIFAIRLSIKQSETKNMNIRRTSSEVFLFWYAIYMPNLEFLVSSANGIAVFYDPVSSHAVTHFTDTPQLKELTQEILARTILNEDQMFFDTDMGRIVGKSDLVNNDDGDLIVYAKRKNRDTYTSFNKTKAPQPCAIVAVGIEKADGSTYKLLSAWIGSIDSPPFPGDENETPQSKDY